MSGLEIGRSRLFEANYPSVHSAQVPNYITSPAGPSMWIDLTEMHPLPEYL